MAFSMCLLSPIPPKYASVNLSSLTHCATTLSSSPFPSMPKRKPHSSTNATKPSSLQLLNHSQASTTPLTSASDSTTPLKKVLVPIGYGTEEMEAVIIVDVLRRAGAEVIVASVEPQLEIEAAGGTKLIADTFISNCSGKIFDLVALPGGMPGAARLRDCEVLRQITSKQAEENRLYGAICAAPAVTLLPWGLLKKKQTTCHPAFMDKLPTFWAVKSNLQVSKGLTTSRGPGTSFQFALSLVHQLFGESTAKNIGGSLLISTADDTKRKEEFNEVEWSVGHNPRVLIPVANGSEEIEIVAIVDVLRRAKIDVVVASTEKSVRILACHGIKLVTDRLLSDAAKSTYDIIILPGGVAGSEKLCKSRILRKLLQEQDAAGRIYGAVCSSPTVLHKLGLLKGKRATTHPSGMSEITNAISSAKVVIDGKLITSIGLANMTDFALAIVSKLFGHARARSVAEGLVFDYPRI